MNHGLLRDLHQRLVAWSSIHGSGNGCPQWTVVKRYFPLGGQRAKFEEIITTTGVGGRL